MGKVKADYLVAASVIVISAVYVILDTMRVDCDDIMLISASGSTKTADSYIGACNDGIYLGAGCEKTVWVVWWFWSFVMFFGSTV